tara:strand:+ start:1456 stop:1671 length:216 start_codon:yes stop_codon:yes gene_type:complete
LILIITFYEGRLKVIVDTKYDNAQDTRILIICLYDDDISSFVNTNFPIIWIFLQSIDKTIPIVHFKHKALA